MWRRSPQEARKQLDKTLEAGGVEFRASVREGLERQFTHLLRWSQIAFLLPIYTYSWLAKWRPTSWEFITVLLALFAFSAGISIYSALRTIRFDRQEHPTRRVATLTPRTVRSYLHPIELAMFALVPVMGTACLILILMARSESSAGWWRVALIAGLQPHVLWRFRQQDQRVPA